MPTQKPLSTRTQKMQPSGIRRIFDLACANPDGIDLSIGVPDFETPQAVKDECIHSIEDGFNKYVSTKGIPELREKLQIDFDSRKINYDDFLITAGATGGYTLAMLGLVSPGDEVLITDPYFVAYANVVIMCEGTPKLINTYPDFTLREEEIVPLITEKTKAIVVNHPNNPTGTLYRYDELKLIADIAEKYGLYIVADEVYDKFCYSEDPFVSFGNVAKDAIVISGFSKSAAITGWRLGYVSGPQHVMDALAMLQQYSYVCANSVAQKAAVKALDIDLRSHIEKYRRRSGMLYDGLKDHFNIIKPGGAFYIFPEAPKGDAAAFVEKAIEKKVFIIPGQVFSSRNTHFRISFAADDEKIVKAMEILNDLAS